MNELQEKKKKKADKKSKPITVKANKKGRHIIVFMNIARVIAVPIYYLLKPFRFFGKRKVKDGPCVYISNHYTLFDPVYIGVTTWEGIHFVAKKEVENVPVLRFITKRATVSYANRDGSDVRTMLDCLKCLKNGEKIALFPEGTRNKIGADLLPFHHGAAMISIKTKAPIVPIMIYEKPRCFRVSHILIDEPFELTEYYDRKLTEDEINEADEKIRQRMSRAQN